MELKVESEGLLTGCRIDEKITRLGFEKLGKRYPRPGRKTEKSGWELKEVERLSAWYFSHVGEHLGGCPLAVGHMWLDSSKGQDGNYRGE